MPLLTDHLGGREERRWRDQDQTRPEAACAAFERRGRWGGKRLFQKILQDLVTNGQMRRKMSREPGVAGLKSRERRRGLGAVV